MEVANTAAYYDTATITAVKSFILQATNIKQGRKWQTLQFIMIQQQLQP